MIDLFMFLAAPGAFNPLDAIGPTMVAAVLIVLWLGRAWSQRVHHDEVGSDLRLKAARAPEPIRAGGSRRGHGLAP